MGWTWPLGQGLLTPASEDGIVSVKAVGTALPQNSLWFSFEKQVKGVVKSLGAGDTVCTSVT